MLRITTQIFSFLLVLGITISATAQDTAPPSAAKTYNEALAKMKEKAYVEAFEMFEQALELADTTKETDLKVISLANRNASVCAYRCGAAARKEGDIPGAVSYFDKGIVMNPTYFGNYLGRAQAIDKMEGETEKAILAYITAGEQAAASTKNKDKAAKLFEKAQNYSASAYITDKDYEAAIAAADVYLSAREEAADGYIAGYYKAASFNKLENDEDALPAIQLAVSALPEGEDGDKYHLLHGLVQQALGNNEEAIAAYQMVVGEKYKAAAESRINALKQ